MRQTFKDEEVTESELDASRMDQNPSSSHPDESESQVPPEDKGSHTTPTTTSGEGDAMTKDMDSRKKEDLEAIKKRKKEMQRKKRQELRKQESRKRRRASTMADPSMDESSPEQIVEQKVSKMRQLFHFVFGLLIIGSVVLVLVIVVVDRAIHGKDANNNIPPSSGSFTSTMETLEPTSTLTTTQNPTLAPSSGLIIPQTTILPNPVNSSAPSSSPAPTVESSLSLTNAPSESTTTNNNTDDEENFLPLYTQAVIRQHPTSPQALAYDWMDYRYALETLPNWRKQQLIALTTFYFATNGEMPQPWMNADLHECEWQEYYACTEDFRYVWIQLVHQALPGTLPMELVLLTNLEYLDLTQNQLSGELPFLGALTALTHLSLPENQLTGSIPNSFGRLTRLTHLDLSQNLFRGTVPKQLGRSSICRYDSMTDCGEPFQGNSGI
jgi:Leucine rich repeat